MKNKQYIIRRYSFLAAAMVMGMFTACSDEYEQELGPRPTGSFTVTPLAGAVNTYVLNSEVEDGFRYQWDIGEGFVEGSRTDTVYFAEAGVYPVRMRAMTRNGHALTQQEITVATTDPASCINKIFGCEGSKTWVLAPEAGALVIGPPDGVWWSNNVADVTDAARTCLFNDEYTFTNDGQFLFDDMGDIRVDDEGGQPWPADMGDAIACYDIADIPEKYQAWGSGEHTYEITAGNKLKLIGTGAHLGLYKAGDAGGNIPAPAPSTTYTILELTANRMVVEIRWDWGYWKFTLVPKE